MKPRVPTLSPILRSDTQGRMLAALFLHPEREYRATELAREAQVSLPTILRDIDRLTESGYLVERTSGRNRYLRANTEHPIFGSLASVLRYAYGPLAILPPLLSAIPGISEAYIFGSWAARYAGATGPDPQDIDVIAVGDAERMRIYEAASEATTQLGREVNIRSVSETVWRRGDDLFLSTIKGGPMVELSLNRASA
ncbi:MAG: winged helix-turn-helix domain-containing protein [Rhodoglobus sp.]